MKRLRGHLLVLLMGQFISSSASAAIVTHSFSGDVSRQRFDISGVNIGDTVNLAMSYSDDVIDIAPPDNAGMYLGALLSIEIGISQTGSYWLFESADDSRHNSILVENDILDNPQVYMDRFSLMLEGLSIGPSINGKQPAIVNVGFRATRSNSMPDMLVDDSLPADLGNYQIGWVTFMYDGYAYSASFDFTPVPIPASAWLLGSGLLGLTGIRRFRFRNS